jgi:AAA15 family ATPase/GTPase
MQTNKSNIYQFADNDKSLDRADTNNGSMVFLKKEDSIFSSIMNKNDSNSNYIFDMCQTTNHNILSSLTSNLIMPFANYLDSSIETLELEPKPKKSPSTIEFKIKYKGHNNAVTIDWGELEEYLSSGTIKGISCLSNIVKAFECGGYLLIDEIENHLNKSIVVNIINMFTSSLNTRGATLIFTTHYSEILDSIDRSDSIYVLNKNNGMVINKFSKLASGKDRKDKKRSDLILSGELNSAPGYKAYRTLVDSLNENLTGVDKT